MLQNSKVRREWNKRTKNVCKPCWELKYCPYGPLVEDFPLLGPTQKEAVGHNSFLRTQLEKKAYRGWRKKLFTKEVAEFNTKDYPVSHEIEFDHIIPLSKSGSTEEHNLRVTCFDCNRGKSNKVKI